ncbi:unnamed protein product [Ectocarpus sp. 8 AP-2014]
MGLKRTCISTHMVKVDIDWQVPVCTMGVGRYNSLIMHMPSSELSGRANGRLEEGRNADDGSTLFLSFLSSTHGFVLLPIFARLGTSFGDRSPHV